MAGGIRAVARISLLGKRLTARRQSKELPDAGDEVALMRQASLEALHIESNRQLVLGDDSADSVGRQPAGSPPWAGSPSAVPPTGASG